MGLHFSTPHVLGVGYSRSLAPRPSGGCGLLIGVGLAVGVAVKLLVALAGVWYVVAPLVVTVLWLARAGRIIERERAQGRTVSRCDALELALTFRGRSADTNSQAAVSDRR